MKVGAGVYGIGGVFSPHDDVIKWKHFPRYWPFLRGSHRSPMNSQHKGQWSGALMLSLICTWINGWVNNREIGDLRRHRTHYDVTVMRNDYTLCWKNKNNTMCHWCAIPILLLFQRSLHEHTVCLFLLGKWSFDYNRQVSPVWHCLGEIHDDVIKWKHFPCYCPFMLGIHRSPWRGALMFSECVWMNDRENNR